MALGCDECKHMGQKSLMCHHCTRHRSGTYNFEPLTGDKTMDHLPTADEAKAAADKGLLSALENSRDKYHLLATCTVKQWTEWFWMDGAVDRDLITTTLCPDHCSLCRLFGDCHRCPLYNKAGRDSPCAPEYYAASHYKDKSNLTSIANIATFQTLCLNLYERLDKLYQEEKAKCEKAEREKGGYWLSCDPGGFPCVRLHKGEPGPLAGDYYHSSTEGNVGGLIVKFAPETFATFYPHITLEPGECVPVDVATRPSQSVYTWGQGMVIRLIDEGSGKREGYNGL